MTMLMADTTTERCIRRKVLILSATVAGGHDAMARNLKMDIENAEHSAVIVDGLVLMSRTLNWFLISAYAWQLRNAPWTLGITFRLTGLRSSVAMSRVLVGWLCGRRLLRAIERERPDVIVSTYPVVTAGLGRLIKAGRLRQPVLAAVTDYGAHAMWVSPEIDLHLVLSKRSAEMVELAGGRARVAKLPVGDGFSAGAVPTRRQARASLGLAEDAFVALIVGGAWGIGDIEGMADRVAESGVSSIIVTGRNEELRARLIERFRATPAMRVIGWTDRMPLLMAASDCLIQNAGGITCLEAIEVGLPIVFFRPIPGHGKLNARMMVDAAAARAADSDRALQALLRDAACGQAALPTAELEPRCDAVAAVLSATASRSSLGRAAGSMMARGRLDPDRHGDIKAERGADRYAKLG